MAPGSVARRIRIRALSLPHSGRCTAHDAAGVAVVSERWLCGCAEDNPLRLSLTPAPTAWLRASCVSLSPRSFGIPPPLFLTRCHAEMQPALQRRSSGGGIEAQRARPLTLATALRSPPVTRARVTSGRTKMAAASLLKRHGGSFFSGCLSRSPLGVLVVAMRASARDANLAARHTRLFSTRLHAPTQIECRLDAIEERKGAEINGYNGVGGGSSIHSNLLGIYTCTLFTNNRMQHLRWFC